MNLYLINYQQLSTITIAEAEDLDKDYFQKKTEVAIEEFWTLNKEIFKESRPKY